jgi:hypothetical protein
MVAQMVRGSIIHNIAEAPHMLTVQPQTGMAAQPAETQWGRDRPLRGRASGKLEQASSGVEAAVRMQADKA